MSDDIEAWFERGVTDGLPVVPPSRRAGAGGPGPTASAADLFAETPA